MVPAEVVPLPQCCPRCRGRLFQSYQDEYDCLCWGGSSFRQPIGVVERPRLAPDGRPKQGRPRKRPRVA